MSQGQLHSDNGSEFLNHHLKRFWEEEVKAVTLTGSEEAGTAVAAEAGRSLKKCVLELGGNNAFVVLNDANQELALNIALPARLQNGGQILRPSHALTDEW